MSETKRRGLAELLRDGAGFISSIITASILPPITEGTEMILQSIDDRILLMERRVLRKVASRLVLALGGVTLLVALFFFLRDFLAWSAAIAAFAIGITVFVIGLLLVVAEPRG